MVGWRGPYEPSPGFLPGDATPTALAERANRLRQNEAAAGRTLSQSEATRLLQTGQQNQSPRQKVASDAASFRARELAAGRRVSISEATRQVLLNPNAGR